MRNRVHTFEITHHQPLIGKQLVLLPAVAGAVEAYALYQALLVWCDARNHARDEKHVIEDGMRFRVLR